VEGNGFPGQATGLHGLIRRIHGRWAVVPTLLARQSRGKSRDVRRAPPSGVVIGRGAVTQLGKQRAVLRGYVVPVTDKRRPVELVCVRSRVRKDRRK